MFDCSVTTTDRPGPLLQALLTVTTIGVVIGEVLVLFVPHAGRAESYVGLAVVFFIASISHAMIWRGSLWTTAFLIISAGGGLFIEAIGVRFGVPFGSYRYSSDLGWRVLNVPAVVPFAWSMMLYPALVVAEGLSSRRFVQCALTGGAMVAWDLFLDPEMVKQGYWSWNAPVLPWLRVPLTNFAGWFLTGALMALAVSFLRRRERRTTHISQYLPLALYAWTFLVSVCGSFFLYGISPEGLIGTVGMGTIVGGYAIVKWPMRARSRHRSWGDTADGRRHISRADASVNIIKSLEYPNRIGSMIQRNM